MRISNIISYKEEIILVSSSNFILKNVRLEAIFIVSQINNLIMITNSDLYVENTTGINFNRNLIYVTKSKVTINTLQLFGGITLKFSGIISENNVFLTLNNSYFENFINEKGGAINNKNTYFVLNFSKFLNNFASIGGAILTIDSNISFLGNSFENNSADYGAAIYFYTQNLKLDLKLENNSFSFGVSSKAGGGIFSVYSIPTVTKNIFFNNTAKYGYDYATPPITLILEQNEKLGLEMIQYLPSSIFTNNMTFLLKDFYNNSISFDLNGKAALSLAEKEIYEFYNILDESENKKQIFGQVLSEYINKSFLFNEIRLNFKPNSTLLLKVDSDLINDFAEGVFSYKFPHYIDSNNKYNYLLKIISTECPLGLLIIKWLYL